MNEMCKITVDNDVQFSPTDCNKPSLSAKLSDRFSLIERLEHNWDGDDAEPVQPELLKFSQEVIKKLLKKGHEEPFIGATPCGTMDMTWDDLGIHSVLSQPDDGMMILYINFPSICEKTTFKYSDYSEKAADQLSNELSGWLIKKSQSHQSS